VVVYTIQDATEYVERQVKGTITVVVSDVPDQVQKPTVPAQGDEGTVTIGFQPPASNGKEITSYEVRSTPAATMPTNCGPPSCTISGLTNGTSYTFSVRAINVHGPGEWSVASNAVIPYGTPGQPTPSITKVDQWAPNAVIRASWTGVASNGGSVSYQYQLDGGAWVDTAATNTGDLTVGGGNHTVVVRAVNSGGKVGPTGSASTSIDTQGTPSAVSVSGSVSGQTVNFNWSGGSASPGGMANVQYQYRINGGGWSGWGSATSASRSGPGTYTIEVQARNKAGAGAIASNGPHTIVQPVSVTLCFTGWNPSYFTVKFSGLSGGNHWFRVVDTGGPYGSTRMVAGTSGSAPLGSYIYYTPPGDDTDGAIRVWGEWSDSGSGGPFQSGTVFYVRDIPAC